MNETPASPGRDEARELAKELVRENVRAQSKLLKNAGKVVIGLVVLAAVVAFAAVSIEHALHEVNDAVEHHYTAEERHGVDDGYKPFLNSAGDHVYAELFVSDGTGVVTTPNDAGVFTAIAGAPLVVGQTDGSGCITGSLSTGLFTVAKRCGVGHLNLRACINRFASSSNVAGTTTGAWVVNGTVLTTAVSPRLVKVETVDAGNVYGVAGCVDTIYDSTAVGDTIGFEWANAGGGITATTREASFVVTKVLNK